MSPYDATVHTRGTQVLCELRTACSSGSQLMRRESVRPPASALSPFVSQAAAASSHCYFLRGGCTVQATSVEKEGEKGRCSPAGTGRPHGSATPAPPVLCRGASLRSLSGCGWALQRFESRGFETVLVPPAPHMCHTSATMCTLPLWPSMIVMMVTLTMRRQRQRR